MREVAAVGTAETLLVADRVPNATAPWIVAAACGCLPIGARDEFGLREARASDAIAAGSPAAPWALHAIARDGLLPNRFAYRFWPSLAADTTPAAGTSPQFRAIATANRDRKFVLGVELRDVAEAEFTVASSEQRAANLGIQGVDARALTFAAVRALEEAGFAARPIPATGTLLPERLTARSFVLCASARAPQVERIASYRIAVTALLTALR